MIKGIVLIMLYIIIMSGWHISNKSRSPRSFSDFLEMISPYAFFHIKNYKEDYWKSMFGGEHEYREYNILELNKNTDPIPTQVDKDIAKMLIDKQHEMVDFLNQSMSPDERKRIGFDIIDIMPRVGDLINIELKRIDKE